MLNGLCKPSTFKKYIVFHGLRYRQYANIRDKSVHNAISAAHFSIETLDVGGVSMTSRHCIPTMNNRNNASKQLHLNCGTEGGYPGGIQRVKTLYSFSHFKNLLFKTPVNMVEMVPP